MLFFIFGVLMLGFNQLCNQTFTFVCFIYPSFKNETVISRVNVSTKTDELQLQTITLKHEHNIELCQKA